MGYVVEAIENHADIDNYCISFDDSTKFSKAYTEDLLDCLSVAYEQNKKVLSEHDLADVFKWISIYLYSSKIYINVYIYKYLYAYDHI